MAFDIESIDKSAVFDVTEHVKYIVQLISTDDKSHRIDIRKIVRLYNPADKSTSNEFFYTKKGINVPLDMWDDIVSYIYGRTRKTCPHCKELLIKD